MGRVEYASCCAASGVVREWWLRPTVAWLGQLLAQRQRALDDPELGLAASDTSWIVESAATALWVPLAMVGRIETALVRLHEGAPCDVMSEAGARAVAASGSGPPQRLRSPFGAARWTLAREGSDLVVELQLEHAAELCDTTRFALSGYLRCSFAAHGCELREASRRSLHFVVTGAPAAGHY